MTREPVGDLFGPAANLESEDAVLLRGATPIREAEAMIAALSRLAQAERCPTEREYGLIAPKAGYGGG